jgi:hypothetical protein
MSTAGWGGEPRRHRQPRPIGLPSQWYLARIDVGFADWALPESELRRALEETRAELA